MRIDDGNKVLWCSEELIVNGELHRPLPYNNVTTILKLIELSGKYGLPKRNDNVNWKKLINAIFDSYEFKLEENKYYWRKKAEYLASFENVEKYLVFDYASGELFVSKEKKSVFLKSKFTEAEAERLLGRDFKMFEKVEVKP